MEKIQENGLAYRRVALPLGPEDFVYRLIMKGIVEIVEEKVLPLIGGAISGDKAAYRYLPSSVLKFPGKREWMSTMQECGFTNVVHKAFSLGICRMYIGEKQYERQGLS